MSTVVEIKSAIEKLSPAECAELERLLRPECRSKIAKILDSLK